MGNFGKSFDKKYFNFDKQKSKKNSFDNNFNKRYSGKQKSGKGSFDKSGYISQFENTKFDRKAFVVFVKIILFCFLLYAMWRFIYEYTIYVIVLIIILMLLFIRFPKFRKSTFKTVSGLFSSTFGIDKKRSTVYYDKALTEQLRNELYDIAKSRCENCRKRIYTLEIHHIIARHEGGDNSEKNLIVLCPDCHAAADRGVLSKGRLKYIVRNRYV